MNEINFNIEDIETIDFALDVGVKEIYPALENLEVTPTTEKQIFTHENSYGYDVVTILPTEAKEDLDNELTEQSSLIVTQEVTIDDIEQALQGKVITGEISLQDKEVTPTTSQQEVMADSGYSGLGKVTIEPVTSSIDSDIKAENIKKGVDILGVTGTLEEGINPSGELSITENGTYNVTEYASANVNIEGKEDLSNELNSQGTLITEQEVTIEDILEVLDNKMVNVDGTLEIFGSGEYDVSTYQKVNITPDTTMEDGLASRSLTEYENNRITTIATYGFNRFTSLVKVRFGAVKTMGGQTFSYDTGLVEAYFDSLEDIPAQAFINCSKLEKLYVPKVKTTQGSSVGGCTSLQKISLDSVTSIGASTFANSTNLETVIVKTSDAKLQNVSAFNGTKIANGTGYIYFYREDVDAYKSATNWSTYANQIRAIEDYPDICGEVLINE